MSISTFVLQWPNHGFAIEIQNALISLAKQDKSLMLIAKNYVYIIYFLIICSRFDMRVNPEELNDNSSIWSPHTTRFELFIWVLHFLLF